MHRYRVSITCSLADGSWSQSERIVTATSDIEARKIALRRELYKHRHCEAPWSADIDRVVTL